MMTTLHIKRMRVHARHGVLEQETNVGAWFYVSLEARFNCNICAYKADDLCGTINYASVAACINEQMRQPCHLLERLVFRMGNALMADFPQISHLSLFVAKENPPMKAQCEEIGIKMEFSRD